MCAREEIAVGLKAVGDILAIGKKLLTEACAGRVTPALWDSLRECHANWPYTSASRDRMLDALLLDLDTRLREIETQKQSPVDEPAAKAPAVAEDDPWAGLTYDEVAVLHVLSRMGWASVGSFTQPGPARRVRADVVMVLQHRGLTNVRDGRAELTDAGRLLFERDAAASALRLQQTTAAAEAEPKAPKTRDIMLNPAEVAALLHLTPQGRIAAQQAKLAKLTPHERDVLHVLRIEAWASAGPVTSREGRQVNREVAEGLARKGLAVVADNGVVTLTPEGEHLSRA